MSSMWQMWASLLRPGGCREAGHLCQCAVVPTVCLFFERLASIVNMHGNGFDVCGCVARQEAGGGAWHQPHQCSHISADMHIV